MYIYIYTYLSLSLSIYLSIYIYIYIYIYIIYTLQTASRFPGASETVFFTDTGGAVLHSISTVSFHNFKSQNFKLSVSNPKSKQVAYVSVLSQISNCQGLGRKNKFEFLKTDRISLSFRGEHQMMILLLLLLIIMIMIMIIVIMIKINIMLTPSPPTKSLGFEGFDSSRLLILRGGNSHVRGIL